MNITYAHMGTTAVVFEALIQDLGHTSITPPPPTRETLTLGTSYAPEFACIPFKILLGTYLETLKQGADTIISGGGLGPCRAGYYGELHRRILKELGYNPEMIFFWPPLKVPLDFIRKAKRLKGKNSWRYTYNCIRRAWNKLIAVDDLEIKLQYLRPREIKAGLALKAWEQGMEYLRRARTEAEIEEARRAGLAELGKVEADENRQVLKVGIVGEIYVQLEPFANQFVEEVLGRLGCEARRSIYITNYARSDIMAKGDKEIAALAAPYLDQNIGGHGQSSVGDIIRYARQGFDGVVQLAPFTCIPEIVAKSITPKLSTDFDIPVITLFIDEQTGSAGVETRLEAFVDLMHARRRRKDLPPNLMAG